MSGSRRESSREISITDNTREVRLFGLRLSDVTLQDAAQHVVKHASTGGKLQVYFVNAHCVNVAARDKQYHSILENSRLLYADGVGMAVAARICGDRLLNNVNGTDLFPLICEEAARQDVTVALLGSRPGVADTCARRMMEKHPGLRIVWTHHGYTGREQDPGLVRSINDSGARILLVGKGVPMQELWIAENSGAIEAPVVLGVGALFDFYSETIRRAPPLLRRIRLEWLFRLLIEPRRMFTRYIIGNPLFILRAIRWRITGA
jgi:N-acetylglucosaminyldiphosphoundecaprenol N-acetyl-beta-D-mannosaminyltransferase